MRSHSRSRLARLAVLLLASAWLPAQARDEAGLRACLKANLAQPVLVQDLTVDQTDGSGSVQRLAGTWYWQRGEKSQRAVLKLSAPKDLAGAAYLMLRRNSDEDLYMYLPSIGKVRRVTGAAIAQSLFGSGLSAFDLKFLMGGLIGGSYTRLGATTYAGRSAELWRYLPPPDPQALYDRLDLTIDDQWCLPMKTDLFGGVPWKTLTLEPDSVRQVDGQWLASRATLEDLRAGTRAQITMRNERATSLPENLFRPDRFYRVAP